jgi:hypothetical protein
VADQKQVKILKKGVAKWNAWRSSVSTIRPDLSGADLRDAQLSGVAVSGADLSGANLTDAYLYKADLRGTNLRRAELSGVELSGADLSGADLSTAQLRGAHLGGAKLTGAYLYNTNLFNAELRGAHLRHAELLSADLTGADLSTAQLRDAHLGGAQQSGANLTGATLSETVFANVDLTSVIGLETCNHFGPSIIDHRTLVQSKSLPLPFLRGVGLPDKFIDYLPSLLDQAIQHYSCFISYSAKDDDFAKRLYADLQSNGVRCWFAPHDLPIGAKIWDAIDEAIKLRDKLLLILSNNSIDSDWVEDEVQKAFAEERDRKQPILFPIRIDDAVMETSEPWARKLRDQRNIGDFRRWKDHDAYKDSFERVVRDLTVSRA